VAEAAVEAVQPPIAMPACIAFQLGWDMSRLYHVASVRRPYRYTSNAKLPAQRDFGGPLNTERRLAAVAAGLRRLEDSFERSGLACPSLTRLLSLYTGGATKEELREAIYRLHVEVLISLQAADARLGSAYNVGRVFADTATPSDLEVLKERFSFHRVQGLRNELAQLAASFPAHAARGVSDSLCIWQSLLGSRFQQSSPKGPEGALPRQAEIWRGLLSGERVATDRLEVEDYVDAAKRLVDEAATVAWGVAKSYKWALLVGFGVAAAGLAAAIVVGGAGAVIGGIAAAASALGVSWKGVASTLTALGDHLRAPVWGAELDLAVAQAITLPEARNAYDRLPEEHRRCAAARPRETRRRRGGREAATAGSRRRPDRAART
jgi:hypothetical protein